MHSSLYLLAYLPFTCLVLLTAAERRAFTATPPVLLDDSDATVIGSTDGLTNKFLGIPYAQPPVGELRFRHPQPIERYASTYTASNFGPFCPQQYVPTLTTVPPTLDLDLADKILSTVLNASAPQSEDCLTLNVWTPPNANPESGFPVAIWIHGGGFQDGGSALYDGGVIVERAVQLSEPMIVVTINYRLSALGWLTGAEARDAGVGNLGYSDQRLALQWIQKHIRSFGGDRAKVVIWGQSAGAMSVAAHMLTNGGNNEGLFRGAFMQSGSLLPLGDMQGAQVFYDNLVADAGCEGAFDTLRCLRYIPFHRLKAAMDKSPGFYAYQSLATSWWARADGKFLPKPTYELAAEGSISRVPLVIGSCDDEGTIVALTSLNITTTAQLHTWLSTYFFINASRAEIDGLLAAYPEDPSQGSPFNTGRLDAPTPQFKRIAALVGDMMFEAPRKAFLAATSGRQDVWTYTYRRNKDVAVLGSAHIMDLFDMFGPSDMTDHLIHFVSYLDPNGLAHQTALDVPHTQDMFAVGGSLLFWPKYHSTSKTKLVYMDGSVPLGFAEDTERDEQLHYMDKFLRGNPVR
ncbi:hypothetical protein EUX98_g6648 [Antrodiella citrinella]|uniref:Carboxylic ester hydrolase n=1 Tax=Antrodiella citrinella TaxID=2447956 RepID=A0A4S4MNQ9_9APHY|nr:hypothetical protein EUX98_g6648 [Antrodiella citrinella]